MQSKSMQPWLSQLKKFFNELKLVPVIEIWLGFLEKSIPQIGKNKIKWWVSG